MCPIDIDLSKLQALLDKLPDNLKPIAEEYGPALIDMTAKELWAWIMLFVNLEHEEAYRTILSRMTEDDIMAEWDKKLESWVTANKENAIAIAIQKSATLAVLDALLQIAFVALTGVPLI